MSEWFQAVLLGLLEGLTEFIPVSSTGHLIVVGHLIEFKGDRAATFEVFIQLGAILAVVFIYKDKFLGLLDFEKKSGFSGANGIVLLALTTAPALVVGLLIHSYIKTYLFNPMTVALGLGLGGLVMIWAERHLPKPAESSLDEILKGDAFKIGLFQCLAMWPGVSRSGATIIGGMMIGMHRKVASEYSFLAAVPVMCAATIFDLYKSRDFLSAADVPIFLIGFVVSFISAWFAVKFFLRLISTHTLEAFGWYRVALSVGILAFML